MTEDTEPTLITLIKPITPDQVSDHDMPLPVIEVFNTLIKQKWDGRSSKIKFSEAIDLIVEKMGISKEEVYKKKYLNIEYLYREAGWEVRVDIPIRESYPGTYTFMRKVK